MQHSNIEEYLYPSPVGTLRIAADDEGVYALTITTESATAVPSCEKKVARAVWRWLDAYFARDEVMPPRPPLHIEGTLFQQQVWHEIATVPRGCAITYGTLAARLASLRGTRAMSAQAIGQAVKHNRHLILVPCHRVVAANGIGGYVCGLHIKHWLLRHEGINIS